MAGETLSADERRLIGRCLYEAANGAYFPDWEFETLIGVDRVAVRKTASSWLIGETISDEAMVLTLSVLNNLLGYPHNCKSDLEGATGVQISDIRTVLGKLDG